MVKRVDVYAFALAAIALIGGLVLLALDNTVPDVIWVIAGSSGAFGAGVNLPVPE